MTIRFVLKEERIKNKYKYNGFTFTPCWNIFTKIIILIKWSFKSNDEIGFIHLKFNRYNNVSNNSSFGFLLPLIFKAF